MDGEFLIGAFNDAMNPPSSVGSVPGAINPGMKDLLRLTLVSDVRRDKLILGSGRVGDKSHGRRRATAVGAPSASLWWS